MALISTVTDAGTALNAQALMAATPGAVTRVELGTGHVTTAALARARGGVVTPFTPRRESLNPPVFAEAGNPTAQVTYFDSTSATFTYNELAIFVGATCIYYECDSEGAAIGSKGADALQKSVAFTYSNGDAALVAREYVVMPLATERNMGLVQLAADDAEDSDITVAAINRVRRLVQAALGSIPDAIPAGVPLPFAGTVVPSGYLLCDGRAVSRITYAGLFAAIGTTWGAGNGATTFNLPDLRRRTLVGAGGAASTTLGNTVGSRGGEESHTLTTPEMPPHSHSQPSHTHAGPSHTHGSAGSHSHSMQRSGSQSGSVVGVFTRTSGGGGGFSTLDAGAHTHPAAGAGQTSAAGNENTGPSGGGQAHNVMQPSAVVNYIIKT